MPEWKDTVNLPRTGFSMKANLQTAEPEALARWEAMDLYGQIRRRRRGARKFVFHDGPPYANARIHLGTALNKILKDFVIKSRSMQGYDVPYLPGYDCHGLPIELKVDRELGPKKREMSIGEIRRACREYASRFTDVMTGEFKRLMVFGDWEHYYLTMNPRYQADIARALGKFVERGLVYKGKKPVHWCIHCRTALAEAEVEYEDHASPSIYVEFPLTPAGAAELFARVPALDGRNVSVLIWTTTPWTIPSNLAIAFHPEFEYGAYDVDGRTVVVAEGLAERVGAAVGRSFDRPVAHMKGADLEGIRFRHPLYERDSVGVLATYVTLEQGTGAVHTAPGHGADDFHTGIEYGLEIYAPVGPGGHFLETVDLFGGQRVFDANPRVEEALASRGRLWRRDTVTHQYPHCWRCHNPVVFLATSQWFVRMDGDAVIRCEDGDTRTLRDAARYAIDHQVRWIPAWGRDRIYNMVSNRPDWCISRQRAWGVPIPAVDCTSCGAAVLTTALIACAADVFERHNADAWYERPLDEFLPPGFACPSCGGRSFERERDILDVWFDSGSSHEAVLARSEELGWPADLYLEGSDQHRGWFQSSLLVALATRGRPPFREVLTHGFLIDLEGRKMSKSLGNAIVPQEVIKESGAEIIRLWVAMTEFTEELRVSKEILTRVVDLYRKWRNTCRILVANLYDFDPAADVVPLQRLDAVDRYALARYAEAADRILRAYDEYDFSTVTQTLNALMTVHVSAFYVDVTKDRMYTLGVKSHERRSTQTVMCLICDGLARLLAPILPVTADELWRHMPGERSPSVHLEDFPQVDRFVDRELVATWDRLMQVRDHVNATLEQKRKEKAIGTSLGARVTITASGPTSALLEAHRADLPMLFIVSDVALTSTAAGADELRVAVDKAPGVRCGRCWRYVPRVRTEPDWAGICDRCVDALAEPVTG
ncbi:MAG: isoleucine--tRNA ligase [Acidobacteria bacterium RIFCSPLOWO2_02_FULL_68_18]|nr:MAG: isoleucine--tRNA ligase [Acidobacteria bacterium RIFCSPLOWO2_02_FULL_68_18]OFW51900.1 MAG: isoleucine--tRNA ligase [Acidobacteria bacterium RIFCSPLOWO2_12_FULL_68_19]